MINVGGREVILSTTVFIPSNETSEIEVPMAEDDRLSLILAFEEAKPEKKGEKLLPSFSVLGEDDKGIMTFKNWTSTFGASISKPINFATDNRGNNISFIGNIVKLGEMYKVEFQLMKEGDNNG